MTTLNCTDEDLWLDVPGKRRRLILRTPDRLTHDPALLIELAKDCRGTLDEHPYNQTAMLFLSAGHRVASFDLPNHGDDINEFGEGLDGMAKASAAGVDVFEQIRAAARATVALTIARGYVRPGRVFVAGTSRGGLSSLHAMVGEPAIAAGALYAPVTHLPVLREFAPIADRKLVRDNNAALLIDRLAGRDLYITIGMNDARVGSADCLEFHARYQRAYPASGSKLHIDYADGHSVSDAGRHLGGVFLLERAAKGTNPGSIQSL